MARELPSLNALRVFETVAQLESVSQAAHSLHVTHGAVSRQMRTLEQELGVALFAKVGRGIELTPAGQHLQAAVTDAFSRLRQACSEVRQHEQAAPFLLACPGSLLARWFIPRLDRLNQALPALNLHLSASEGEQDPRKPGVSGTLLFAAPPWPADMQVYPLADEYIGPVFSPRFARAAELQQQPASALAREKLLHTFSRPQAWADWATASGLVPEHLQQGQGFEHLYYLLEAALSGLGVAIAPRLLVADDLASGRLLAPWGFVATGNQLSLWVPARQPQAAARELADWLKEALCAD